MTYSSYSMSKWKKSIPAFVSNGTTKTLQKKEKIQTFLLHIKSLGATVLHPQVFVLSTPTPTPTIIQLQSPVTGVFILVSDWIRGRRSWWTRHNLHGEIIPWTTSPWIVVIRCIRRWDVIQALPPTALPIWFWGDVCHSRRLTIPLISRSATAVSPLIIVAFHSANVRIPSATFVGRSWQGGGFEIHRGTSEFRIVLPAFILHLLL